MTEPGMTSFDALMGALAPEAGAARLPIDASWLQGRSAFGGLVAAAMLRVMRSLVPPERRPRSMQIAFVGPVPVGEVILSAEILRAGRSASFVEASAAINGSLCTRATALFGRSSPSRLQVSDEAPPPMRALEDCIRMPFVPGVTPVFTQHFAYAFAQGALPFSGSEEREMGGYCRFTDAPGRFTEEATLAFVDAWPPPILPMLSAPCPVSTATWTIDFLTDTLAAPGDAWWTYHTRAEDAAEGYARETSRLWTPDGRLATRGVQTTAVFDRAALFRSAEHC
jgi:acyl-CoA thioesterase